MAAKRAPHMFTGPSSSTWVIYPGSVVSRTITSGVGGSVGKTLAGGRREHVGLARTGHDMQLGALLRDLAAVDADHEVLGLAADLGGAVDVTVGAELLHDVDGDGEAGRGVL